MSKGGQNVKDSTVRTRVAYKREGEESRKRERIEVRAKRKHKKEQ